MNKLKYEKLLKQKKIKPITCLTAYTISIAKILDGKVDLINTYGFSDLDRTKSLTLQSSFRLA